MSFDQSIFATIFQQSAVPTFIVKVEELDFEVVVQNEQYRMLTGRQYDEPSLSAAFLTCMTERTTVKLPPVLQSNSKETWLQTDILPVIESDEVTYLICQVFDISKQILLDDAALAGVKREHDLTEELAATNEELRASNEELQSSNEELEDRVEQRTHALTESESRFRAMVEQSPVPMLVTMGEAMIFDIINQPMLDLISKDASVIGMPWHEAMPELEGQDIISQLLETYDSGISWEGAEVPIMIYKNETPVLGFYNISYKPLIENGQTIGMLQSAIDVTDLVKARLKVEELNQEQQTINEELAATNEELHTTNDELSAIQGKLENMVVELAESEQQLEQLINMLPAAVVVIRGENLIAESINNTNLAYWNKTREQVIGRPLLEILPELATQPFPGQLRQVMQTGEIIDVKESPVMLTNDDGTQRETFVDYTYQPLTDSSGVHTGVLVMSAENTERVLSRKLLEQFSEEMQALNEELTASNEELASVNEELYTVQLAVEEGRIALRLAIDAAEIGTWFIHSETREFITDARLKELFGYYADEALSIEQALAQIREDYRSFVATALENAIYNGGDYDVTYPVIGLHDEQLRWLRAIGNLKQDPSGAFSAFTGVVLDITQQKNDEIRKNDFIGMVSHELKTPLTSLNGYIQMLQLKAKKANDTFTAGALDQSIKQVKRMTNMINGFLNVSRLESAKIYIDKQPFDMADLIFEMEQETRALYSAQQFIFHPVEPIMVVADQEKVGQVINNFINNAVKYSKPDTTIQISCIQINGFAQVSISDEGMGIAENDIPRLFERYYRVENNNQISGFGIGLYLSAEIIERHQGKIWVESEPGKGSTFYFSLPL